jgi:hypothetical protein
MRLSLLKTFSFLLFLGATPAVFAGVPLMVGNWHIHAVGINMIQGSKPGAHSHWAKGQTVIDGEATILTQNDRTLTGVYKFSGAPGGAEHFVAVIGTDGGMHLVDQDGFADYHFVNSNRLEEVYRHVTATDSVICNSVWTREK